MKKLLTILGIIIVSPICWGSEAKADLVFCNRFEQPIYMALAQKNANNQRGTIVKGWWYANPGQCQTVYPNSLNKGENYGYYAISADGKQNWQNENNSAELCVNDRGFDLMSAALSGKNSQCVAPDYPVKFKWMNTENKQNLTFDFKI